MASIEMGVLKCPSCTRTVDMHVLHFCSLLGPQNVECHWCGNVVPTDRREWADFSSGGKRYFAGMSAIYAVLAFFMGGLGVRSGVQLLKDGRFPPDWGIDQPLFLIGGAAFAILVGAIQLFRIRASLQRTRQSQQVLRTSLLGFDVMGQFKTLLIIMAFPGSAWAITRFTRDLPEASRSQIQTIALIAILLVFGVGILVYRGSTRKSEADNTSAQSDLELFEIITRDFDVTKPLCWSYSLTHSADNAFVREVMMALRDRALTVSESRPGASEPEAGLLSVSERRIHTAESFGNRLREIDNIVGQKGFVVSDSAASNV